MKNKDYDREYIRKEIIVDIFDIFLAIIILIAIIKLIMNALIGG